MASLKKLLGLAVVAAAGAGVYKYLQNKKAVAEADELIEEDIAECFEEVCDEPCEATCECEVEEKTDDAE